MRMSGLLLLCLCCAVRAKRVDLCGECLLLLLSSSIDQVAKVRTVTWATFGPIGVDYAAAAAAAGLQVGSAAAVGPTFALALCLFARALDGATSAVCAAAAADGATVSAIVLGGESGAAAAGARWDLRLNCRPTSLSSTMRPSTGGGRVRRRRRLLRLRPNP